MSRAREWALKPIDASRKGQRARALDRPGTTLDSAFAQVTDIGDCHIEANSRRWVVLEPDDALKLARWILDVFGEESA